MKSSKRERSTELNAIFEEGIAVGWYMAVKECFKDELDIKLTDKKKDKIAYREWTQGADYCFSEGQVFYDTRQAYDNWHIALKHINIACQIVEAKPNRPEKYVNEITGKTSFKTTEGFVKFILYKPNADRNKLFAFLGCKVTQNQFVDFLKNGPNTISLDL